MFTCVYTYIYIYACIRIAYDIMFLLLLVYLHATFRFPTRRVFDFSQASVNFEDPEGYFELEGRAELVTSESCNKFPTQAFIGLLKGTIYRNPLYFAVKACRNIGFLWIFSSTHSFKFCVSNFGDFGQQHFRRRIG